MCSCRRIPRIGTNASFHGSELGGRESRAGVTSPRSPRLPSDARPVNDPTLTRFARMPYSGRFALLLPLLALSGCRSGERPVFEQLAADRTGIAFANTITTSDSLNVQTDPYIYNGAGVAVGDVDNDGLPDLFFAGNMVSSRLYLNKGDMRFADITKQAG